MQDLPRLCPDGYCMLFQAEAVASWVLFMHRIYLPLSASLLCSTSLYVPVSHCVRGQVIAARTLPSLLRSQLGSHDLTDSELQLAAEMML